MNREPTSSCGRRKIKGEMTMPSAAENVRLVLHSLYFLRGTSIHAPYTLSDILLWQEEGRKTNSPMERKYKHKKIKIMTQGLEACASLLTSNSFFSSVVAPKKRQLFPLSSCFCSGAEEGKYPHNQPQGSLFRLFVV